MEAAAVFAVAQHRNLEAAAGFVLSDTLTDAEWTPDFGSSEILHGLDVLVESAVDVILSSAEPGGPGAADGQAVLHRTTEGLALREASQQRDQLLLLVSR